MIIKKFESHYIMFLEKAKRVDIFMKKRYNKIKLS